MEKTIEERVKDCKNDKKIRCYCIFYQTERFKCKYKGLEINEPIIDKDGNKGHRLTYSCNRIK